MQNSLDQNVTRVSRGIASEGPEQTQLAVGGTEVLCLGGWTWVRLLSAASPVFSVTDTSSGSDDEGSVQGDSQGTPTSSQGSINMEHWISQAIHGSTTSTTSSSSTQSGGSGTAHRLADVMAQTHIGECPPSGRAEPCCYCTVVSCLSPSQASPPAGTAPALCSGRSVSASLGHLQPCLFKCFLRVLK